MKMSLRLGRGARSSRPLTSRHGQATPHGVMGSVSCALCPESCFLCPVSCFLCPVSCFLCPMSCALCPMSCALCPVTCDLCPLPSSSPCITDSSPHGVPSTPLRTDDANWPNDVSLCHTRSTITHPSHEYYPWAWLRLDQIYIRSRFNRRYANVHLVVSVFKNFILFSSSR